MGGAGARSFEEVLASIEERERTARRRIVIYTVLPVVIAAALIWYASQRISALAETESDLREQIGSLKEELSAAEKRLQSAASLNQYLHPIDPMDVKTTFSRHPAQAKALGQIYELGEQGVSWRLGGQTPDLGFDSPSFAAYILRELDLPGGDVQPGESLLATSRRLLERLEPISEPRVGDLTFYSSGYVLFNFDDRGEDGFVIGMTPFGITALEPDFAEVISHRRIDYPAVH